MFAKRKKKIWTTNRYMDFVRNRFGTNEPLLVKHFFPHFLAGLICFRSKLAKKWGKKCSTGRGSFVPNLLVLPVLWPCVTAISIRPTTRNNTMGWISFWKSILIFKHQQFQEMFFFLIFLSCNMNDYWILGVNLETAVKYQEMIWKC